MISMNAAMIRFSTGVSGAPRLRIRASDDPALASGVRFTCCVCSSSFPDSPSANRHWRISHQRQVRVTLTSNASSGRSHKLYIEVKRSGGGFDCAKCQLSFEDPADWKEHVYSCMALPQATVEAAQATTPGTENNTQSASTPHERSPPCLIPARNPLKNVSRAKRAMIRYLDSKLTHPDHCDIANNLGVSPDAVRASIQNESHDNTDSDSEYVQDFTVVNEDAEETFHRTSDSFDHLDFCSKLDPAEELTYMGCEDVTQCSPDPEYNPTTDNDNRGNGITTDMEVDSDRFHVSHPLGEPDVESDDHLDAMEVEQLLDDGMPTPSDMTSSPEVSPLSDTDLGELEYPDETEVDTPDTVLYQKAVQSREHAPNSLLFVQSPVECLADAIVTCFHSLGADPAGVTSTLEKLGCRSLADFDALSHMPAEDGWFIFRSFLCKESPSLELLQLFALEWCLHARRTASTMQSRSSPGLLPPTTTVVFDFLNSLRRPLTHHITIFSKHKVLEAADLQELCCQRQGCGLDIVRHIFMREGFTDFEWLILREGLARCIKPPGMGPQEQVLAAKREGSETNCESEEYPAPVRDRQSSSQSIVELSKWPGGSAGSNSVYTFLSTLSPSQAHHFTLVHDYGVISAAELLELADHPDIWDDVGADFMKEGMSILEWIGMVRGLKHLSTRGIRGNRSNRDDLLKSLETLAPGLGSLASSLRNLGIRTGYDLHVLARFEDYWNMLRPHLLAKGVAFTDWLKFKQALRSLNSKVACRSLDEGTEAFLHSLRRPLDAHRSSLFTTAGLDRADELDALCEHPTHWNDVIYLLLDHGELTLMEALAFRSGLEKRASELTE
ncbi:hypothetical protein NM688_g4327 [Phlebia brevispora]|uniref:Uncharacterized protein n=1 Tax=Phlebia brevispora TaxID=194682 RepID=A0ACC1T368_9APHY|nr:hypothetical protein NM688_g4327 [Phlebia brevispora]